MRTRIVLGSRGSALALAQARMVQETLQHSQPAVEVEIKVITTSGDRRQDLRPADAGNAGLKGLFTKEIQDALIEGSIDAAVHSLKDLPGITPPELCLAAVLPRADTSDLLISGTYAGLESFPERARIGTGSVRRKHQVQWLRPGLEIVELRGNVPTRLEKLVTQRLDGIVLARAGLDRLGYALGEGRIECDAGSFHAVPLDVLPAIGQGAIGVEIRREDTAVQAVFSTIDHAPSHCCIRVERALLGLLNGDCRLPVAARATIAQDGALDARAIIFPEDSSKPPVQAHATGSSAEPELVAMRLFQQLTASA